MTLKLELGSRMLTLKEKIGQMFLVGFDGTTLPEYLVQWLQEGRVGGVILFSRNVENPQQLAKLTQQVHDAAKFPALVAIDQEGGVVARLRDGFTESPGAMALACAQHSEAMTRQIAQVLAREMRAVGINWDYAPVLDLTYNPENQSLGARSFGTDPQIVARLGAATVRGLQSEGVAATPKHFPGLGNTAIDTHLALPVLDEPLEHLLTVDLVPYRAVIVAGAAAVMTTHTIYSALDPDLPATLSPVIVPRLLRDELGFDGVVTTDCMEMKAIADNFTPAESAILAAQADVDLILFSHTPTMQEAAYEGLLSAARAGRVSIDRIDAANARVAALKERFAIDTPPDLSVVRSEKHLKRAQETARATISVIRDDAGLLPVDLSRCGVVEFFMSGESMVIMEQRRVGVMHYLQETAPDLPAVAIAPDAADAAHAMGRARQLAGDVDTLIIVTRSVHLRPYFVDFINDLLEITASSALICARNPFDARVFPQVGTVICTCGDSAPSLQAAADALRGEFVPQGKLPEGIASFV